MEYKRFNNTIVARIDKGEEILDKIKELALKENIKLANVNALGAINDFTVGVFKTEEKKYYSNEFKGNFEIVSLTEPREFGKFFLVTARNTPNRIKRTPIEILKVKCSLKNTIPKNIAVKGSNAPRIAVFVEPISLIATFIVSSDIIVGSSARPVT